MELVVNLAIVKGYQYKKKKMHHWCQRSLKSIIKVSRNSTHERGGCTEKVCGSSKAWETCGGRLCRVTKAVGTRLTCGYMSCRRETYEGTRRKRSSMVCNGDDRSAGRDTMGRSKERCHRGQPTQSRVEI